MKTQEEIKKLASLYITATGDNDLPEPIREKIKKAYITGANLNHSTTKEDDAVLSIRQMAEYLIQLYKDTGKRPYYVFAYDFDTQESSEMWQNKELINRKTLVEIWNNTEIDNHEHLSPHGE